jgi:hypothetical protein
MGRHFEGEIVLWAVRWYCRYGVSYRNLEQMMSEHGVSIHHSTISDGDRRKVGGQAATAIGGCGSLAGRNFCPKPVPSVPL